MKTITYHIPAISCGHCIHTIKMELGELPGIQKVEGDPQTRKVTVEFTEPATEDQIEKLLMEIHYPPQKE
ncbi:MAG TPA: heavy-metal-associated domain-containing protein [Anaerolineaceae bacterium]|nr:heavy-metal-associated domain-containing protein [Longilinea sp.]HNZ00954.1 heavy-metal-associated domain-containing protein [Anaerolineaceae bacterium]HPA32235.1 heavy-metal-associated domain-containing protein [Anaerolineaceae bacterium]HQO96728.1 heavy-metal-associated domain-containing protein [Anaerolineaceae bacterium]HQP59640.1 heavy-metal-associated domain-containing protein [Anaerolineaceae bacterium]